jgi:hypothetical protein
MANLKSLLPNDPPDVKTQGLQAVAAALDAELKKPRVVSERTKQAHEQAHATVTDFAPPDQRPDTATRVLGLLPSYVVHEPGASRAAQIAAHAVITTYETAAQTLEALGQEFHGEAQSTIQKVIDTAALIREKGAEAFREVERSQKITSQVVESINDLKARMNLVDRLVEADPMMREVDETKSESESQSD